MTRNWLLCRTPLLTDPKYNSRCIETTINKTSHANSIRTYGIHPECTSGAFILTQTCYYFVIVHSDSHKAFNSVQTRARNRHRTKLTKSTRRRISWRIVLPSSTMTQNFHRPAVGRSGRKGTNTPTLSRSSWLSEKCHTSVLIISLSASASYE